MPARFTTCKYFNPEMISFSTLGNQPGCFQRAYTNVIPTEYSTPSLMVTVVSYGDMDLTHLNLSLTWQAPLRTG